MKSNTKWLISFLIVPLAMFAQDDSPPPFDDTPPDYVPETPIDSPIVVMVVIAICVALYFLLLRKSLKKLNKE